MRSILSTVVFAGLLLACDGTEISEVRDAGNEVDDSENGSAAVVESDSLAENRIESRDGDEEDDAVQETAAQAAAKRTSCEAPAVTRANLNLARCNGNDRCIVRPQGKKAGYVAERLVPLDKPLPSKIVSVSNPGFTDKKYKIASRGAVYGINPRGGGYGVYFAPPGEENLARFGYGDGWQADLRDGYHANDWNPTQAGIAWSLGTPVDIQKIANGFRIKRFNMGNFINDNKDFVENDAINKKAGRDFEPRRVNGKDEDKCNEKNINEEVRSEFDFQGEVEDVAPLLGSRIPAFRFLNHIEYARLPNVVMQFSRPRKASLLSKWMNKAAIMKISPLLYDHDTAGVTDVSLATLSWGLRIKENSRYRFLGYKIGGGDKWSAFDELKPGADGRSREYLTLEIADRAYAKEQYANGVVTGINAQGTPSSSFAVIADGKNPKTAKAIGLYYPTKSPTNRYQTVGIKDGRILYAENRMLATHLMGVAIPMGHGKTGYNLLTRMYTNGMLEPRRTAPGVREALRSEVYVFYGTPEAIEREIRALEKSGKFR